MHFSSFFIYGISLSPVIHCLWSIGLHVCQLCSLAFMSTDVYNKPHSLTWRPYIYIFLSHTQCYMESWDIFLLLVASTRSESRKLWLMNACLWCLLHIIAWSQCSHWMLFFWHHSAGPSEIFSVVQGEVILWVVLIGQWHSQTHLHLTLNVVTLLDVWEAKDHGRHYHWI